MSKVDICCNYEIFFYEPEEIVCMQSAGKHYTSVYVLDPHNPKGFDMKLPCKHLKVHEQKLTACSFMMRVYDNWVVNLKQVRSVTKNNLIKLKLRLFTEEINLDPKLRDEFLRRMKLLSLYLFQLPVWVEEMVVLVA